MNLRTTPTALLISMLVLSTIAISSVTAVTPTDLVQIAKITGENSINQTDLKYQVYGTDLGVTWDNGQGQVLIAFGDTYGEGWGGFGAGPRDADWRCNTLALSSDTNLADGLHFDTMVQDTPGHARQILDCKQITNDEETVIPTAGIAVGGRNYIHYMSVHDWGAAGTWHTNYSGIAYSDDQGQTWTKDPGARWINDASWSNKFQQAAFVRNGGYVYMFATPNGRMGNAYLARVPEVSMLNKSAYQYWDGTTWQTDNEGAAAPIVAAPVAELSVQYNSYFRKWLMVYLDEDRDVIVLREATSLTGPWSGQKILVRSSDYPGLYGGYIHPWTNSGQDLYFLMSQWGPYNVYLMRARLSADSVSDNLVSDPGFEEQGSSEVSAPWMLGGNGGIDRGQGHAHSGANNAWLRNTSGWNDIWQTIAVKPYANYRLTGWIRSSDTNTDGYFGVRTAQAQMIQERKFASLPGYTQLTVDFNSGPNSLVQVFAGMWANGADTWIQVDDIALRAGPLLLDGGFEQQNSSTVASPWGVEGPGSHGIDRGLGFARSGSNNAWIRTTSTDWNAIAQRIAVTPNTNYRLSGWVRTSNNFTSGYFGVRPENTATPLAETRYGQFADPAVYHQLTVDFNSGSNSAVIVFVGYWGPGQDSWVQIDDLSVVQQ